MQYVSSDRHIGHKNILKYDNRPFANIDEHDQAIIDTINLHVKKDDTLYVLGDVFLCSNTRARKYLSQLKCNNIYYTVWNHDWRKQCSLLDELWRNNLGLLYENHESRIVLSHYPLQERRNKHYGWKHYHGHSHHKLKKIKGRQDCTLNFNTLDKPLSINNANDNWVLWINKTIPRRWQDNNHKATKRNRAFQRILDSFKMDRKK